MKRLRDKREMVKGSQDRRYGIRRPRQVAWVRGDGKTKAEKLHVKPYQKSHGGHGTAQRVRAKNVPSDKVPAQLDETKWRELTTMGALRLKWTKVSCTFDEAKLALEKCKRVWFLGASGERLRVRKQVLLLVLEYCDEARFDVLIGSRGMVFAVPESVR